MKYYFLKSASNVELLTFVNSDGGKLTFEEERALLQLVHDESANTERWGRPKVEGFFDPGDTPQDFASTLMPGCLAINQSAWAVIAVIAGGNAEALPLQHADGRDYSVLRINCVLDALDYRRAAVLYRKRVPQTIENVRAIKSFAFLPNVLGDNHLFRLPETWGGDPIVSELVKNAVEQSALQGARFDPLPMA